MNPLVSVLLPVLDGERYIGEAVESVLSQSFSDWELLIQDNCSDDNTIARAERFNDARVKLARNSHRVSMSANFQIALRRVRGRYVQFFSHDDRMLPSSLETQVSFLETHPAVGFSFSPLYLIEAEGKRLEASFAWDGQYVNTPDVCNPIQASLLFYCYGCLPGSISAVMARRNCLEDVGGIDASFQLCFDWDLWIRLARKSGFGFVKERLVEVRTHAWQGSRNPDLMLCRIKEIYRCLDQLESSLPSDLIRTLRWGRKRRYAKEFVHQAIDALLAGRARESLEYLRILRDRDGIILPVTLWLASATRRLWRRLMGKNSIALRAAFGPKWISAQLERITDESA